jgi:toxin ParE1/3/4
VAQLIWTDTAVRWLEDIFHYVAADNPVAANAVMEGIVKRAELAAEFPAIGSLLRKVDEGEVRVALYGHYRLPYLHRKDAGVKEILGVFHGAMDMERYLP